MNPPLAIMRNTTATETNPEPSRATMELAPTTHIDGVDLAALAQRAGTPVHAYSTGVIRDRITALKGALEGLDALICFAVKANPNGAILRLMAAAGFGADVVSSGELRRSLRAGIPAARTVFSGVGKTDAEIAEALDAGVLRFNLESRDEFDALQRLARRLGIRAQAAVRINPDVDAGTHAKISTGRAENKFGVSIDEARRWFDESAGHPDVQLDGLHVHIGSQIVSSQPYAATFGRVAVFARELAQRGQVIRSIDVGGGLGVAYRRGLDRPIDILDYVGSIRRAFAGFAGRIILEPGRWLVADAGVLLTRVIRVKQGGDREFLVLDAAMNDLQRPSLYDAWHDIEHVGATDQRRDAIYDVVGPVCESADTFARDRRMPECRAGDLLMIRTTGAYGASMASTYNSRPLAAEVLLDRGSYSIVRRRQSFEEMIAGEVDAPVWATA